jgi:hypothetical protein
MPGELAAGGKIIEGYTLDKCSFINDELIKKTLAWGRYAWDQAQPRITLFRSTGVPWIV